jgi:ADP-ribosyl-[dinitrogen reductase] hydrolase
VAEVAGVLSPPGAPAIRGTGYVVQSLEAALWAFDQGGDFREGALLAVNLGDDADTTGAIFGQIGGAYYGAPGVPTLSRERLARQEELTGYRRRPVPAGTTVGDVGGSRTP